MKTINIGGAFDAPEIALGCMRISGLDKKAAAELLQTALDEGINFFDHADIYGGGRSHEIFRDAAKEIGLKREDIMLQTKCGICPGIMYDFSTEHILSSVENSLRQLGTDYVDALLLHRPDALMEPEEVAEAFDVLASSGKVRHFGVSNHNPLQIELLKKYLRQPLIINQLQFGVAHTGMIDRGINVNTKNPGAVDYDGGILDYCRLHDITIQPWSPMQYGAIKGAFLNNENFSGVNKKLADTGEKYGVTAAAAAIAWILRHPAKMQPVVGTTNPKHLKEMCAASGLTLTREEWYGIYLAAGNTLP